MSILFFGHSSFAAKSLKNFYKKKGGVIYFSRKKNKKNFLFDLRKKNNLINKKQIENTKTIFMKPAKD